MTRDRQLVIWSLVLVVVIALLIAINDVLLPFVAGMVIAYFLDPLADKLERKGCSRTWATIIITAVFFAVLIALFIIILPLLQGQVVGLFKKLPVITDAITQWLEPIRDTFKERISTEQLAGIKDASKSFGGEAVKWLLAVLKGIFKGGAAIFNIISLIFITPVVTFYLIRDWNLVVKKIDNWLPRDHAETIRQVLGDIDRTIAGFVRGQGMVCSVLAAIYGVGLTLVGLDFGLLIGIATGLISFVPYFGMLIGMAIALAVAIVQFGDVVPIVLVLAVFGVGQVIESFLLTPVLVGDQIGLHAVWVIFALLVGGALFGFTGVLLAVPIAATVGVLVRFFLGQYLDSPLYAGQQGAASANSDENADD